MTPTILVINAGSSSVKFATFQLHGAELHRLFTGNFERLGSAPHFSVEDGNRVTLEERHFLNTELSTQEEAVQILFTWLKERHPDVEPIAIGHRVVHGGPKYSAPVVVDDEVLTARGSSNRLPRRTNLIT